MGCAPHFHHSHPWSVQTNAATVVTTASLAAPAGDEERKRLAMLRDIKRRTLGPRRSRWNT
jgi:hypothetical protein